MTVANPIGIIAFVPAETVLEPCTGEVDVVVGLVTVFVVVGDATGESMVVAK